MDPQRWVDYALFEKQAFAPATANAYPGIELYLPDFLASKLGDFFRTHVRDQLGAKRVLAMHSRLSIATHQVAQLSPIQWLCHRDRLGADVSQCVAASVLYLFHDINLGGTSFYAPRKDPLSTETLMRCAASQSKQEFVTNFDVQPGYLVDSNAYFLKLCEIPAKWNRLIFYDGSLFHSSTIRSPQLLSDDPRTGRLTLNGFFTCRRRAT